MAFCSTINRQDAVQQANVVIALNILRNASENLLQQFRKMTKFYH